MRKVRLRQQHAPLPSPSALPHRKRVICLLLLFIALAVASTAFLLRTASHEPQLIAPSSRSQGTALSSRVLDGSDGRPKWDGVWRGFREVQQGSSNGSQAELPSAAVAADPAPSASPTTLPPAAEAAPAESAPAAAPLPPAPQAPQAPQTPLLVIGIPTLRRVGDADYVSRTLQYLLEQTLSNGTGLLPLHSPATDVPGAHPLRVRVVVMDHTRQPGAHVAFEAAMARFCSAGGGACSTAALGEHTVAARPDSLLAFAWNGRPRVADGDDAGDDNVPGARVRAQSRDVVALLQLASALHPAPPAAPAAPAATTAYMFLEDDFRVCQQGLAAVALAIARASLTHSAPPWNAIRVSYGLNGGILRGEDVPVFAGYLDRHLARRPPDHLWVEWFAGERQESAEHKRSRPHVAFRYNVLEHFGATSSLRGKPAPLYAMCYEELSDRVVFEVEAFKAHLCGHDVVWPCWPPADSRYADMARRGELVTAGIPFVELALQARANSVQTYALGG